MISSDVEYVAKLIRSGVIKSPCLELGVACEGANNKDIISQAGIKYFGTDIVPGKYVDYLIDFEWEQKQIKKTIEDVGSFGSILVLNVLEHTFDPLKVLDNVVSILRPGGSCVIITPTIWPLHDYPLDCWRINPGFYEEYCKRRNFKLMDEYFEYVGFSKVQNNRDTTGSYVLPQPSKNQFKLLYSRIIHKVFNTAGRGMFFPSHVATGAVLIK